MRHPPKRSRPDCLPAPSTPCAHEVLCRRDGGAARPHAELLGPHTYTQKNGGQVGKQQQGVTPARHHNQQTKDALRQSSALREPITELNTLAVLDVSSTIRIARRSCHAAPMPTFSGMTMITSNWLDHWQEPIFCPIHTSSCRRNKNCPCTPVTANGWNSRSAQPGTCAPTGRLRRPVCFSTKLVPEFALFASLGHQGSTPAALSGHKGRAPTAQLTCG